MTDEDYQYRQSLSIGVHLSAELFREAAEDVRAAHRAAEVAANLSDFNAEQPKSDAEVQS